MAGRTPSEQAERWQEILQAAQHTGYRLYLQQELASDNSLPRCSGVG